MKHIGIIGVSAEGAALCFKTICAEAGKKLGDFIHPEITIHEQSSKLYFDAEPDWRKIADILLVSAQKLSKAGADFAIIPSNTMHFAFSEVKERSPIPLLSIVEVAADECAERRVKKVGVLGTKLTMEGGLYTSILSQRGVEVIVPESDDRNIIDQIIFKEIVPSRVTEHTARSVLAVIKNLQDAGAEAIILGCTELPIVVDDSNSSVPTIDTTRLLARKALEYALS